MGQIPRSTERISSLIYFSFSYILNEYYNAEHLYKIEYQKLNGLRRRTVDQYAFVWKKYKELTTRWDSERELSLQRGKIFDRHEIRPMVGGPIR